MDAVEFFKTANRICEKQRCCKECPIFYKDGRGCIVGVDGDAIKSIEKAVPKVEQWAKDHPVKTRQSEFLKMFPNAMINESDGILCVYPCDVEGVKRIGCANGKGCNDCRLEYWLAEVTDND